MSLLDWIFGSEKKRPVDSDLEDRLAKASEELSTSNTEVREAIKRLRSDIYREGTNDVS